MNRIGNAIWMAACALFILSIEARAYRASDFHWLPPFLPMEEKPSLTFILDTSSSMLERAYSGPFNATREYLGYFDAASCYCYDAESDRPHFFVDNAKGEWSGNFLNWAAMLRIDVARKLLSGGKINTRSECYGSEPLGPEAVNFSFNATELGAGMTPLRGLVTITPRDDEGLVLVSGGPDSEERYALRVKNGKEGESGLLQRTKGKARVAMFTFEGQEQSRYPMSDDPDAIERIKDAVNSVRPQGNAPLAKTLREVHEYLRQDGGRGPTSADDPYYFPSREQTVPCTRQSVILVSAGRSSGDHGVPDEFKNRITTKRPDEKYHLGPGGSTFLIDVAYLGHTTDLRPEDGMEGAQNWDFYAISLTDGPDNLLQDAAKHGKFKDTNANNLPDIQDEFDADGNGLPDNYFTAQSGRELDMHIGRALRLDVQGVASGTSAAISPQTRSGEGAAYQAIFFPPSLTHHTAPHWSGQVHAYLVDAHGNLREDTNGDKRLTLTGDRVIEFADEKTYAHADADGNGLIDDGEKNGTALGGMTDINFLWSSSSWLNSLSDDGAITQRSSYASIEQNRYIVTFVDINQDMVVNANHGEIQDFALPANPAEETLNVPDYFYNYLTLYESDSGTLRLDPDSPIHAVRENDPAGFSTLQAELARRQVEFIRGKDLDDTTEEGNATRKRTNGKSTWRLGDIVFSSPTVVGKPDENYHLIYNDTTYEKFRAQYMNRRQVVYVGANDGMLHAFNGGFWNSGTRAFDLAPDGQTEFELGQELWAYVPYNLLAHLKWLMHPDYGANLHAAYMDLTPIVFDARIFVMSDGITSIDEDTYPGGWGTILVAGMRLGGAAMEVDIDKTDGNAFHEGIDRTVSSAYVIMDVTDPESPPNVLAELTMPGQGFTTCVPAVMPMGSPNAESLDANTWYLVFGSGPADAAGRADRAKLMRESSDQPGKLFVLDLNALYVEKTVKTVGSTGQTSPTGDAFAFAEAGSFISEPVCVDLDIPSRNSAGKFSTDLVYFGTVAGDSASPAGKIHRLRTGNGPPEGWKASTLVNVGEPVSTAPSVTVDEKGSLWIHFGTGRLFNHDDTTQTVPMSFYGIREPETDGIRNWDEVFFQELFNSDRISVTQGTCGEGVFSDDCIGILQTDISSNSTRDWTWLTSALDQAPGWKHSFSAAGERVLGQAAVLGGSVVFTSYLPSQEICTAQGTSRLWSLFYKTGTSYFWPSLDRPGGNLPTFIELGPGRAANPILHVGESPGTTAIIQSTTGDLTTTPNNTPLPFKSGCLFWRKNTD